MYLIRMSEENIRKYYPQDEMKTPVHLCIGEEAIAAGICQVLNKGDQIVGTYRSHGIYLAKTGDTHGFFAELYGKVTGTARGKAGSMHLCDPKDGFMSASAVVGTTIPVALGCAWTNKIKRKKNIVVSFFGDGALDEGVFWESLNFACLKKLPIIFICEDNDLAIHAKKSERHGYSDINRIISAFNCLVFESMTTDAEVIAKMAKKAIYLCKKKKIPVFMHLCYYRYLEHVGINKDFQFGYRSEEEFKKWLKIDPIKIQRAKLLGNGYEEKAIQKIEQKIIKKIEKSIQAAKKAKVPTEEELYQGVYA